MSMLRSFFHGFRAPFFAVFFILRSPSLLALVSVPLLISLGLFVFFFVYVDGIATVYVQEAARWMAGLAPPWLASAGTLVLRLAVWVTLFVVSSLGFTVVGGILASPFNDWLSRRVSLVRLKKGQNAPVRTQGAPLSMGTVIVLEFKRTAILIILGGIAFFLAMVPLMQVPALLLGSASVAFEYLGFPLSRRDPRLSTIVKFMARHPLRSLGFGVGVLVLMAIPFAGIFTIPLAVTGATLICDEL